MTGANRLPKSWLSARVKEFCAVVQGQSPPGSSYNTEGNGLPFFQGKAEFGDLYPEPRKWCTSPLKVAEPDDVLISVRAPVGPTNLAPSAACIGRGLAAIRPLDGIPSRYILYGLRATVEALTARATGTTFEAVSGDDIREHELPLAPLAEQRRIVAEIEKQLTRLDAAVAALEGARPKLKRYRASVLKAACEGSLVPTEAELARAQGRNYEPAGVLLARVLKERRARWEAEQLEKMRAAGKEPKDDHWKAKYTEPAPTQVDGLPDLPEGWTWATWEQVGFAQNGRAFSSRAYSQEGIRLLRPGNLGENGATVWTDANTRFLPRELAGTNPSYVIGAGELVMNLTAQSLKDEFLGRTCLTSEGEQALLNQRIARLTPVVLDRRYLLWMFKSRAFRNFVDGLNTGSLIQHMFTSQLATFTFPLPPLMEQSHIAAEVERLLSVLDELDVTINHAVTRAARLRQSLLKRAFEGKLVPQDPNDEPASVLLERIRAEREGQSPKAPPRRTEGERRRARAGRKAS